MFGHTCFSVLRTGYGLSHSLLTFSFRNFFVVFLVFFKKQLFPLATIKRQLIYLQIQWQVTLLANNVMDIFDSTHSLLCFRRQLQKLVLVFVKKSGLVYLCLFLYNIHSSANFLVVQSELGDENNTHFFLFAVVMSLESCLLFLLRDCVLRNG